jgi:hypothetical protein
MAQQVEKFFGIRLAIDSYIDKHEYADLRRRLSGRVLEIQEAHKRKVWVYIHKLDITIREKHLGVRSLEDRLARLDVTIRINQKAKQSGFITFVDPNLAFRPDDEVEIKRRMARISYSLSGAYCARHAGYCDYIATLVADGCPPKFKTLGVTATAYPAAKLKRRIDNLETATTKLQFPLTGSIQLALDF